MLRAKFIAFFMLAFLWSLPLVYAEPPVSQGSWAIALVRSAGWEKQGIPAKPYMNDYYDLLSGRNFINVNLRSYTSRLGSMPDTLIYTINAAHSGRYHLIVYVTGNPLFFAIDKTSTASIASGTWGYQDLGTFILSRGIHNLYITIPEGSSIAALYLSSYASDSIEPDRGWNTSAILDNATAARTMDMMLHLYNRLPFGGTIPYTMQSGAGADKFMFQIPYSDNIVTLQLGFPGPSAGSVMIDSSVVFTYSTMDNPSAAVQLPAVSLGAGTHTAFLKVQAGQMPVSFVINRLNSSPQSFLDSMQTLGYNFGMANYAASYSNAVQVLGRLSQESSVINNSYYSPAIATPPVSNTALPDVSGCGATTGVILYKPGPVTIPDNTFIAVAPFENLTGTKDATAVISGSLQEALIESSNVWVTDWDKVADQLVHYGFKRGIPIGMTLAKTIVSKLRVNMILYGSIVEYDYRMDADGKYDIPSVGIELTLLNVQTGRVLFAGSFVQSGTQGESREDTARALAASIFGEMSR
ncbi:MAG: penicillin-binding protein activator LpoB [Deltaproteobacteria bacterium]|nr:penicillin-binding protein activator LpoB [Deltaproteobacteria bacterium]